MFAAKNELLTRPSGYQISRSLRFRSSASAYLSKSFSSSRTLNTKGTFSAWVKRGALGADSFIFGGYDGSSTGATALQFKTDNTLMFDFGGSAANSTITTQVFRDVSSWYHILIAIDTTSATTTITGGSTDRVRLYVNGTQISAFSTTTVPTQNSTWMFALNTANNKIGTVWNNTGGFFDGYLAEVNFIDGQALTPSSFGAFDTNGVWQPKAYTGTYGTNGFYLPFSLSNTASTYGYQFNQTPSYISAANTQAIMPTGNSTWSVEAWVNFSSTPSDNWAIIVNTTTAGLQLFWRPAINAWEIGAYGAADVLPTGTLSASSFVNSWNHIVFTSNGTQLRIFINGVLQAYAASTYSFGAQGTTYIGSNDGTSTRTVNGYISNLRVCKGSIPTSYQTTSTTVGASIFLPPSSDLTSSSQGAANVSLLTAQSSTIVDNSSSPKTLSTTGTVSATSVTPFNTTANLTSDASGAGNNWAPNNISLATGTTYDSMIDSPTNYADGGNGRGNYAVLNPLSKGANATLSDANLSHTATGSTSTTNSASSTIQMTSGKWYWEATPTSATTDICCGIAKKAPTGDGLDVNLITYYMGNGDIYNAGATISAYGASLATNDVLGIALDVDAGKIWFSKNGTWQGTGSPNPATGTSAAVSSGITGNSWLADVGHGGSAATKTVSVNFGQRPFAYTPPSGFSALNTQNLPTPTIANGAQYMAAVTYTGTGANQTITATTTNSGNNPIPTTFAPDFVWVKERNATNYHCLMDSVRGTGKVVFTNTNTIEEAQGVSSFNSNGFSIGTWAGINTSSNTYIAWQWQAGGAPTTDNVAGAGNVPTSGSVKINGANSSSTLAGSIAATRLSANTSIGFSVVTYTGNGTSGATVAHGLGVAPSLILPKVRSRGGDNWCCYHSSLGATGGLLINSTNAFSTDSGFWNNTSPSNSFITLGTYNTFSSQTYVAYCFAPVSGYSAFGSYTGNGSTDGPFVYLGFRPRFLMFKRTDAVVNWEMYDTSRDTYNPYGLSLNPNLNQAEADVRSGYPADIVSNGFKIRHTGGAVNASGGTYVYAAFAENPFKYSRAR